MTKTFSVLIVAIVVVVGIASILFFKMYTGNTITPAPSNTGGLPSVPEPVSDARVTVRGADGTSIPVNNLKQDPSVTQDSVNKGYYYFDQSSSITAPYTVEYIDSTQFFNVVLTSQPIGAARQAAEQYLMRKLGITQSQMCRLNFTVSTPYSVDQTYGGDSLGFSFCPGATQLP